MPKQIKPCPKCKASHGWYEKHVTSFEQYYGADGDPSHACDNYTRGGRIKRCFNCGRNITKLIAE